MSEITRQFFSVGECAGILGIGRSAAYDLVRSGKLRSVKLGDLRAVRVPVDELQRFIDDAKSSLADPPAA